MHVQSFVFHQVMQKHY